MLPPEELQAALAHELGHVQLGHFGARRERRTAERKTRDEITEKGNVGAALGAIPLIGPLLAVGIMGTQIAQESAAEGKYRAYDREEEQAADRFALDLLERVAAAPADAGPRWRFSIGWRGRGRRGSGRPGSAPTRAHPTG